ncbi:MAG: DUF362 domain-containing protein [Anaerolineae bacterium]|nr:DUF362 domain-containing protein [Anaerolineae bacterium]
MNLKRNEPKHKTDRDNGGISRRTFLRAGTVMAGGLLASRCIPAAFDELAEESPLPPFTGPRPTVALAQADRYDGALIRRQVHTMLDQLGGLGDVVKPGDRVAIKTNLTGGTGYRGQLDLPATESYVTHPEVVRALGEAVLDSGASELYIVESVYDADSFPLWGHTAVADDLGATLVNLNRPGPGRKFVRQPVGDGWMIYEDFIFNKLLTDIDVLMSVTKMKCHACAGVTLSMKNLVGLVPAVYYRLTSAHNHRSALHGDGDAYQTRLPRVIVDLNRARPIDFALIDGVMSSNSGEGPWNQGWQASIKPGVLAAGKNALATDAVAAAAMGFDPMARSRRERPFRLCDNHLELASRMGLGTHDLDHIDVVGESISGVRYEFVPYGERG